MMDDLQDAIDRLWRVQKGELIADVYPTEPTTRKYHVNGIPAMRLDVRRVLTELEDLRLLDPR